MHLNSKNFPEYTDRISLIKNKRITAAQENNQTKYQNQPNNLNMMRSQEIQGNQNFHSNNQHQRIHSNHRSDMLSQGQRNQVINQNPHQMRNFTHAQYTNPDTKYPNVGDPMPLMNENAFMSRSLGPQQNNNINYGYNQPLNTLGGFVDGNQQIANQFQMKSSLKNEVMAGYSGLPQQGLPNQVINAHPTHPIHHRQPRLTQQPKPTQNLNDQLYSFKSNMESQQPKVNDDAKSIQNNPAARLSIQNPFKPKSLSGSNSPTIRSPQLFKAQRENNLIEKPISPDSLISQMKAEIKENDLLLAENEKLQSSLGFVNPQYLNQIEAMLTHKEVIKKQIHQIKENKNVQSSMNSKVTQNLMDFLYTENEKLKDLISSYQNELKFLKDRIRQSPNNSRAKTHLSVNDLIEVKKNLSRLSVENERLKMQIAENKSP